jgi:hypothetical protein
VAKSGGRAVSFYDANRAAPGQDHSSLYTTLNCSYIAGRYERDQYRSTFFNLVGRKDLRNMIAILVGADTDQDFDIIMRVRWRKDWCIKQETKVSCWYAVKVSGY